MCETANECVSGRLKSHGLNTRTLLRRSSCFKTVPPRIIQTCPDHSKSLKSLTPLAARSRTLLATVWVPVLT